MTPDPASGAARALRKVAKAVADPALAAKVLRHRQEVRADQRRLAEQLGPAWATPAPPGRNEGTDALFLPVGAWPWQVKFECVVGKALALRGLRPAYLVWRNRWPELQGYARLFGVANPVFLDDHLPSGDPATDDPELRALLDRPWSFGALGALEFHGASIGRQALSSAIAAMRHSGKPLKDPAIQERLRSDLAQAVRLTLAGESLFRHVQPRVVFILERGYLPWSALAEVAILRGLNVVQYVGAQRNDAFVLRRLVPSNRHAHPFSLSAASWEHVRAMPWSSADGQRVVDEIRESYRSGAWFQRKFAAEGKQLKPPAEVRAQFGVGDGRKVACIFPHILWDGTFSYGRTLFGDYEAWMLRTLEVACKNDSLDWLVKIHPDHLWKTSNGEVPAELHAIERAFRNLPDHVRVIPANTDVQTVSLYDAIDYGVTVRGTVGIEMACWGVPVVTGGTGRYSGLGFTHDSATEDDYLERLGSLHTYPRLPPEKVELARRHAHALFRMRPWPVRTIAYVRRDLPEPDHPLAIDIEVRARRPVDLLTAPDLKSLVAWALESKEEDFLNHASEPASDPPRPGGRE